MQGIFDAITASLGNGHLLHGGFLWKCASPAADDGMPTNHLMATLVGDADTVYAVGNHAPLAPTLPAFNPPPAPDAPLINPEMTQDQRDALDAAYKTALAQYQIDFTAAETAYRAALPIMQQAAWDAYLKAGADHDAAIIIPDDQPQLSPTNLRCFCGQEILK